MTRSELHPTEPVRGDLTDLQFLRAADVCALLRISRPTLWRLRRDREFPLPTALSRRSIGWRRAEVESWLRARAQSHYRVPPPTPPLIALPRPAPPATVAASQVSAPRSARGRRQLPLSLV